MPNLDDVQTKLEKLWDYLDDMPTDKSSEEMNDLIVAAMDQVEEIRTEIDAMAHELEEVNIKVQNIIHNV
ncbi:hypothetical protein [Brevibacillus brevis]|uniref:hypothetical protein n=1 Tax=Brevibacillus brevis TaxID=1393 RepID=UPI0007D8B1A3|nr:hypothetical protein [Brevibacillus brevis]